MSVVEYRGKSGGKLFPKSSVKYEGEALTKTAPSSPTFSGKYGWIKPVAIIAGVAVVLYLIWNWVQGSSGGMTTGSGGGIGGAGGDTTGPSGADTTTPVSMPQTAQTTNAAAINDIMTASQGQMYPTAFGPTGLPFSPTPQWMMAHPGEYSMLSQSQAEGLAATVKTPIINIFGNTTNPYSGDKIAQSSTANFPSTGTSTGFDWYKWIVGPTAIVGGSLAAIAGAGKLLAARGAASAAGGYGGMMVLTPGMFGLKSTGGQQLLGWYQGMTGQTSKTASSYISGGGGGLYSQVPIIYPGMGGQPPRYGGPGGSIRELGTNPYGPKGGGPTVWVKK